MTEGGRESRVRIGREPLPTGGAAPTATWPSLKWHAELRERAQHLGLPRVLDRFDSAGNSYLVVEEPAGVSLWDAWDDPAVGQPERYGWLIQLAELIRALHRSAAILEGLRPGQVRITPLGQVVLSAVVALLPLSAMVGPLLLPDLVIAP